MLKSNILLALFVLLMGCTTIREKVDPNAIAEVTVKFVISSSGNVTKAWIESTTDRQFNKPTLKVIYRWKFEPAIRNGKPVACLARVTIPFYSAPSVANIRQPDLQELELLKDSG